MPKIKKTKQTKKKLQLSKETLKDLTARSSGRVKGGRMPAKPPDPNHSPATFYPF